MTVKSFTAHIANLNNAAIDDAAQIVGNLAAYPTDDLITAHRLIKARIRAAEGRLLILERMNHTRTAAEVYRHSQDLFAYCDAIADEIQLRANGAEALSRSGWHNSLSRAARVASITIRHYAAFIGRPAFAGA